MKNVWGVVLLLSACAGNGDRAPEEVRDRATVLFQVTSEATPQAFGALVKQLKESWEAEDRDPRWRRTVTIVGSQSQVVEDCSPGEYRCWDARRVISVLPDSWERVAVEGGAPVVADSADFDPSRTYLALIEADSASLNVVDFTVDGGWQVIYKYVCGEDGCSLSETDDWCHVDYYAGSPLAKVGDVLGGMLSSCVTEAAGR